MASRTGSKARRVSRGQSATGGRRRFRWGGIVLLVCVFGLGIAAGYALKSQHVGQTGPVLALKRLFHRGGGGEVLSGQWSPIEPSHPWEGLDKDQVAEAQKLLSVGYAGGTIPHPDASGLVICDESQASHDLRFFTSGHAPQALLMDWQGNILHQWSYDYRDVWATAKDRFLDPQADDRTGCWRRAYLFPNGDLLAIFEGHALIKLDKDSHLIWSYPGKCHHDLAVTPDGQIYVLTREVGIAPRINEHKPVMLDFITILGADGSFLRSVPLREAFENSPYASFLDKAADAGDIFHTNALKLLDGRQAHLSPLFRQGNILTSLRELNVIAIVDPEQERVVWALSGMWVKQHEPSLLENGHILLFDNLGHHGRSKAIELDPLTQEIVWTYADGPEHPLFSKTCGSCQRLPSGHTLIVESDNGRALEVTPSGTIVWEYRNPRRAGPHNQLIAAILDMVVLPEDFPTDWAGQAEPSNQTE
jgi:hypothetical protein